VKVFASGSDMDADFHMQYVHSIAREVCDAVKNTFISRNSSIRGGSMSRRSRSRGTAAAVIVAVAVMVVVQVKRERKKKI
jgi:tetrahydromethanopterin S-methyltransferase subunit F